MTAMLTGFRNHWRAVGTALAIAADALLVGLAFALAGVVVGLPAGALRSELPLLAFCMAAFVLFGTLFGLYRVFVYTSARTQAMLAGRAYLAAVASILAALVVAGGPGERLGFFGSYALLHPVVYASGWMTLRWFLLRLRGWFRLGVWNTLVLGREEEMAGMLRRMGRTPHLGYEVVRVMAAAGTHDGYLRVDRSAVERAVTDARVEMILCSSSHVDGSFDHLEELCRRHDIRMNILSGEADDLCVRAQIHDLTGIPLFWPEKEQLRRIGRWMKRGFDLVSSAVLLILLSPLFLFLAVAAKLESPGPVIFRQKRALNGSAPPFEFYKFRSMVHAAEESAEALARMNESDGALFKIRNDPRLTRVGKFIRRHSLDELPQLVNVLRGDMSLVGPRPLPVGDFAHVADPGHLDGFIRRRAEAKPGMTGLWQISGRSDLGFRDMLLLDLYYIRHQSVLFDIEILLKTLPVVLFGKGAY